MRVLVLFAAVVGVVGVGHAEPIQPTPVYAPKGRPPPVGDQAHAAGPYFYVAYYQSAGTHSAGASATIMQSDPALASGDFHTLAEIAVESSDGKQIVEIGWTIDVGVNGDRQPHIFVFHWINGQPTCYNGCGWVQMSTTTRPGMRVKVGEAHEYGIKLMNGNWWLFYDGDAMGYFPGSEWNNTYTVSGFTQWFGEVIGAGAAPCTEMGNGKFGADPASTTFSNLKLYDPGPTAVNANAASATITNPAYYNVGRTTPTSFGFGGPGAGTGCCTPSSCSDVAADCGSIADPTCGLNLACGTCDGNAACSADNKCPGGVGAPDAGWATDAGTGGGLDDDDGGGCCDTRPIGAPPIVLALFVLGFVLRRRR